MCIPLDLKIFTFLFQTLFYSRSPNNHADFKRGAEDMQSALRATCIKWERRGLSGGQSNRIAFLTTVKKKSRWSLFYSTETLEAIFMTWYEL